MPAALRRLWRRLASSLRPGRAERDLDRELDAHLALIADAFVREGLAPDEAARAARRALGGVDRAKEAHRDARAFRWIADLDIDIRDAWRSLRRHRRSTLTTLVILAVAAAVTASVLGIADAVLLRPLPYAHADRVFVLQMLNRPSGRRATLVRAEILQRLREPNDAFSEAGLLDQGGAIEIAQASGTRRLASFAATASYLRVLGVRPFLGRLFVDADEHQNGRIALLSHQAWLDVFAGDEQIIGRSVPTAGGSISIVGVLPPRLFFPEIFGSVPDIVVAAPAPEPDGRSGAFYPVVRLAGGVTREQAASRLAALTADVLPDESVPVLDPVRSVLFPRGVPVMRLLLASSLALLALACVNLAVFLLVRGQERQREIGLRLALGASRTRLLRPVVVEIVVMASIATAVAVTVAHAVFPALLAQVPRFAYMNAPVGIDLRVGILVAAMVFGAAGLFAVVPVWFAVRRDVRALVPESHARVSSTRTLGRPLVAVQVALTVVLVFGAAMAGRAFLAAVQAPLGFDTTNVITMAVRPPGGAADRQAFYVDLLGAIRRRPDVIAVGAMGQMPLSRSAPDEGVRTDDSSLRIGIVHVLPGFSEALAISVLRGRALAWSDIRDDPGAAVVSERAARLWSPSSDVLGRTFVSRSGQTYHVVGIVADVRNGPAVEPEAKVYAMPGSATRFLQLVIKLRDRDERASRAIAEVVAQASGDNPDARWYSDLARDIAAYRNPRFQTTVLGTLSGLALGLTAMGVFGIVSFLVSVRRRELGIRSVIGATPSTLVVLVVRQSLVPVAIGIGGGLVVSRWASRLAEAQLYKVDARDPVALGLTVVAVLAAAVLAAWLPARRAGRTDPAEILRAD